LNGDARATTTCVLAIDGTNVDQANSVYVDAGGGVTCEFSHTFSTAGTHSIQVTAANPVRGDWDLSNNTAAASITISAANTEHATALFLDSIVNGPLQKQPIKCPIREIPFIVTRALSGAPCTFGVLPHCRRITVAREARTPHPGTSRFLHGEHGRNPAILL